MEILSRIPLFGSLANAGMITAGGLLGLATKRKLNFRIITQISQKNTLKIRKTTQMASLSAVVCLSFLIGYCLISFVKHSLRFLFAARERSH